MSSTIYTIFHTFKSLNHWDPGIFPSNKRVIVNFPMFHICSIFSSIMCYTCIYIYTHSIYTNVYNIYSPFKSNIHTDWRVRALQLTTESDRFWSLSVTVLQKRLRQLIFHQSHDGPPQGPCAVGGVKALIYDLRRKMWPFTFGGMRWLPKESSNN